MEGFLLDEWLREFCFSLWPSPQEIHSLHYNVSGVSNVTLYMVVQNTDIRHDVMKKC